VTLGTATSPSAGSYVEKPKGEDEEDPAEGEVAVPNVTWKGDSIVAF
jgi:hypothetical protein